MGSIIGRTAAGVDRPRVKGCLKTKAETGATRKVLTRKLLILKIGLRVVLTAAGIEISAPDNVVRLG